MDFEQLIAKCKLKFSYKSLNNPEIYITIIREKKMPAELTKGDIFMIRILNNPDFQLKNFEDDV
ncbi:MAG: hypothetical protein IMF19_05150 [Proteobacteria bacterium]|nr:hypothetical protein [Pseudomonadota bacterium]